mgnify:CR=1 FL=1
MNDNLIEIYITPESLKYSDTVFKYDLTCKEQNQARELIKNKVVINGKHYIQDSQITRVLFDGYFKETVL